MDAAGPWAAARPPAGRAGTAPGIVAVLTSAAAECRESGAEVRLRLDVETAHGLRHVVTRALRGPARGVDGDTGEVRIVSHDVTAQRALREARLAPAQAVPRLLASRLDEIAAAVLARLTADLRDLRLLDDGGVRVRARTYEVDDLVRTTQAPAGFAGVRVEADLGTGSPAVHADPALCERVLAALVRNAVVRGRPWSASRATASSSPCTTPGPASPPSGASAPSSPSGPAPARAA